MKEVEGSLAEAGFSNVLSWTRSEGVAIRATAKARIKEPVSKPRHVSRTPTSALDFDMKARVATVDGGKLEPGDLAVTQGGAHVIIFLGGEERIQADPGGGKVITLNAKRDHNSWFQHAMSMHRWAVGIERKPGRWAEAVKNPCSDRTSGGNKRAHGKGFRSPGGAFATRIPCPANAEPKFQILNLEPRPPSSNRSPDGSRL